MPHLPLTSIAEKADRVLWSALQALRVQAVQTQASEAGQDLELAQALWQLGCVLSDQARWADALAPLRQSLLLMESLEHSDTLDVACICNGDSFDALIPRLLGVHEVRNALRWLFLSRWSAMGACTHIAWDVHGNSSAAVHLQLCA